MKFIRLVAALAIITGIVGSAGVAHAAESQPFIVPPASSLGVQFVHVATAANISSNTTIIDHPLTNGNPNAILIVTPNWNPGNVGGTNHNHPIGVYYTGGKWRIFNQDLAAMAVGAAFNVIIPTPGANVFVHTATAVSGNHTFIDNPLTNSNPNAIVSVTPNWNPAGASCPPSCVYTNFPIGVYYDTAASKWAIFNQNGVLSSMPLNAAFNVSVLTAGAGIFVHTATAANSALGLTTINNALTNGNPNAIVFVAPNWNPGGIGGTYNNHNIGVAYDSAVSKWEIFNQDGGTMPVNAKFNVLVLVPSSDIFMHKAIAGNISTNTTKIDNALTNSHPNAIVFTTPNWNPGGVDGTYANFPIGVYYNGTASQWTIFNQNGVFSSMPVNAAFNVLIPHPDASVFVHKATAANTAVHITTIDYPLTNGNPNAIVFVTPNWNPGEVGGVYDNHPIGVYYSSGKWKIFNQEAVLAAAMPVNAAFNVFVPTASSGVGVFVHTATGGNISFNSTYIDNPLANGNPNAIIIVTPNYNPGGVGGTYANFPIGVWYNTQTGRWAIFNQNGTFSSMPLNAAFNVYIVGNYKIYLPLIMR